jgi:hypothetical protein
LDEENKKIDIEEVREVSNGAYHVFYIGVLFRI